MNYRWLGSLLLVLIIVSGAVSCRAVQPTAAPGDPVNAEDYAQIQIERDLRRWIVVDYDTINFVPATNVTPAKLTVPIRSVARRELRTQHRVLWFDDQGRQIGETDWKYAALESSVQTQFQANSISTDAADWRMQIRVSR